MKKVTFFLFSILTIHFLSAQDIVGQWNGILKVQGLELRIVFNITKTNNMIQATMDSPDQGVKDIPVNSTTFENSTLKLKIEHVNIEYEGEWKENKFVGIFKQNGYEIPLNLSKESVRKQVLNRPQEPVKPYPYYSEDVIFQNEHAKLNLSGTLTLPKKQPCSAVILISGSGPQNRNSEIFKHKPFLILADYLTRKGVAVLRYDDRGVGQSEGNFKTATSLDFASDVKSAIEYIKTRKEVDVTKIGLIGHSEGGIIAPMVAAEDKDIHFIVLLASTGIRGDKILLSQQELIARAYGLTEDEIEQSKKINTEMFEMIVNATETTTLEDMLKKYLKEKLEQNPRLKKIEKMTDDDFISSQISPLLQPWLMFFIKYDPAKALEKVSCPVLALNGKKDVQVNSKENLSAIRNILKNSGNKEVTIKEFPNLNHLFQECKTGLPSEYISIEQTFSPIALDFIGNWIKDR